MWKIIVPFILVFVWCASIEAGGTSGELLNECTKLASAPTDPKALIADVHCVGYIDGVIDSYIIVTSLYPQAKFICLPKAGLENEKALRIFQTWLKKNPKERNMPARAGVLLSLKAAYPCKK